MAADAAGLRSRRELGAVVAALVAGGALALVVAQAVWVHVSAGGAQGQVAVLVGVPLDLGVTGADAAPALVPLAVLGLAGAVGLLATRSWARRVLAALLVLAGGAIAVAAAHVLADPAGSTASALAHQSVDAVAAREASYAVAWWWPVLAIVGGLLVAAAGLVAVLRSGRWPAMGARFDAPARTAAGSPSTGDREAARTRADAWSALDRGEDPTLTDGETGAPVPGGDLPE